MQTISAENIFMTHPLPIQGGCYKDQGGWYFKIIAVGLRLEHGVFVLQEEEDILIFPLNAWPILFGSSRLRYIADIDSPIRGEGYYRDGNVYEVILDGVNIELWPCPMEENAHANSR